MKQMGARSLFIGTISLCLVPASGCAQAQDAPGEQRSLARHRGRFAPELAPGPPATEMRPGRTRNVRRVLCLPDRADADRRFGNGCRQGAGKHQRPRCRTDRAYRLAEHRGRVAATGAGYHHQRYHRQSISCPTSSFAVLLHLRSPARRRDWRFTRTACASTKRSATPSTGI